MVLLIPRKIVYSLYERVMNYKTSKCLDELKKTQWFSDEELKKFQWSRLENLLKYSYKYVPYYNDLLDNIKLDLKNGISLDTFQKIPVLNKEIIRKNRKKMVSSKYTQSELINEVSSGTTGTKLIFSREKKPDKREDYLRQAALLRSMKWFDFDQFEKQAILWGIQIDTSILKRLKKGIWKFIFPSLPLSVYNMSHKRMALYAKKINKFQPKVMLGFASALYLFANYLDENQIEIKGIKHIISSAEALQPHQREKIEKVFNCKVIERYGSREFGIIAQECQKHSGLHIIAEHVLVEILDEKGNPCKPGKLGKIVITDLDNYCFPFIRYDIGDIGILSDKKCLCGRGLPLIEKIKGRTWDVIVGANGNLLIGSFWLVKDIIGIKQYQIVQEEFGKFILKLVVDELFTKTEKMKLLKRIYDHCGKDMRVDIQLMDDIPKPESGKTTYIISKVSPFIKQGLREK